MAMIDLGISNFYKLNNVKGSGNSYTELSNAELVGLVNKHWHLRKAGQGETTLDRKVVVPIPEMNRYRGTFHTGFTRDFDENTPFIKAKVSRRKGQPSTEACTITNYMPLAYALQKNVKMEEAKYVNVVCYSAAALLENGGTRTTDCEWEIITLICSPIENEPMSPLTMANNELEMSGYTKSSYTPQEYAAAILYWSKRVRIIDN